MEISSIAIDWFGPEMAHTARFNLTAATMQGSILYANERYPMNQTKSIRITESLAWKPHRSGRLQSALVLAQAHT